LIIKSLLISKIANDVPVFDFAGQLVGIFSQPIMYNMFQSKLMRIQQFIPYSTVRIPGIYNPASIE